MVLDGLVVAIATPVLPLSSAPATLPALGALTEPFPRGVAHYLLGGLFIGLGIASVYLGSGRFVGNSTVLETSLSYVSDRARFVQPAYLRSRDWRVVFAASLVVGAAAHAVLVAGSAFVTSVPWWRLLLGGVLVGAGTRLGKGCTAGHGVCGIGSGSTTSALSVGLFVLTAIGTALLVDAVGGLV
mgnify:CR=1 FL=1